MSAVGGKSNSKKANGYWKSLENALAEARKVMGEEGWDALPPAGELKKHGYNSLNSAISRYHRGIQKFRTTLGQTNPRKSMGYWKSLCNTITEAQQAMQEQKWGALPSQGELTKRGYNSLSFAISKYHRKIRNFRKILTEHETGKTQKQQLEELLDEYIAA